MAQAETLVAVQKEKGLIFRRTFCSANAPGSDGTDAVKV